MQRAVALHGDETTLGAQTLPLSLNNLHMVGVDLRDDHGNIGSGTVSAVVGDHRALMASIGLFQSADLFLFHVDGAEHEIHQRNDLLDVFFRVVDRHFRHKRGHGSFHGPAAAHSFFVCFSRGPSAGCQRRHSKPGVIFQNGGKPLTHHAGASNDTHAILFHYFPDPFSKKWRRKMGVKKKPVENRLPISYNRNAVTPAAWPGRMFQ